MRMRGFFVWSSKTDNIRRVPRLRRPILVTVGVLVALVLLRVGWGMLAGALWDRDLARLKAAGEPVSMADFERPPIPGILNAAPLITKAGGLIVSTSTQNDWEATFNGQLPLSAYDQSVIASVRKTNATPLALMRQARSHPRAVWDSPTQGVPRTFGQDRRLARLERLSALHDHATGNEVAAFEDVEDALFLSRAVVTKYPCVIMHLMSVGISGVGVDALEQMAPDLKVTAETRPMIRHVIAELLDDDALRDSFATAFRGERIAIAAEIDVQMRRQVDPATYLVLSPMFDLDRLRLAREFTVAVPAARASDLPAALEMLPQAPPYTSIRLADVTRLSSRIYRISYDRLTEVTYEQLADRHAVATLLAIALYRADHDGRLPATLDELVPAYLPAVPSDPLAPGAPALRYVPNRRILYSVGTNATDEGGSEQPINVNDRYAQRRRQFDRVFPIDRRPPATRPAGSGH
jgi:hypothetical protein